MFLLRGQDRDESSVSADEIVYGALPYSTRNMQISGQTIWAAMA